MISLSLVPLPFPGSHMQPFPLFPAQGPPRGTGLADRLSYTLPRSKRQERPRALGFEHQSCGIIHRSAIDEIDPNHSIGRPATKSSIQETGAPESCDDVASVEAYPWDDITGGAADSGAGSVLSLVLQEAKN